MTLLAECMNAFSESSLLQRAKEKEAYVPDEEVLRESREKNRALVASLGEEFEDLRNLLKV